MEIQEVKHFLKVNYIYMRVVLRSTLKLNSNNLFLLIKFINICLTANVEYIHLKMKVAPLVHIHIKF